MNLKFLTLVLAGSALSMSLSTHSSPTEAAKFFEYAKEGKYYDMGLQTRAGLISMEDLYVARDAEGNTLISAALKGYPLAVVKFPVGTKVENGKTVPLPTAIEYLNYIMDRLLTKLPKEQAATELLNLTNKDGMTALLYAAQNNLLKIGTILHGKGASSWLENGKKATDFAQDKKFITIAQAWQISDKDNANKTVGDQFADFGQVVKSGFGSMIQGPDEGASLQSRIESFKLHPTPEATESPLDKVTDKFNLPK